MTNQQVDAYKELAASLKLDIERVINEPNYITEVIDWIKEHSYRPYFPLVYATVPANELKQIQADFGSAASAAVEGLFHQLVSQLSQLEYQVSSALAEKHPVRLHRHCPLIVLKSAQK